MTNRTMDCNQNLKEWRGQIEDECVRLKSSGDETALEALFWVLEHVLPNPEDTEHQSVSQAPRYVVAVNGRISAAAMAESFATFDDAADEAREMSFAAPGRNYKVIEIEAPKTSECRSVPPSLKEKLTWILEDHPDDVVGDVLREVSVHLARHTDCGTVDGGIEG